MARSSTTEAVTLEVLIEAEPATIFEFFTDPEKMLRRKGIRARLDPKPGGIYSVDVTWQALARGRYVEVDPPTRVVFTWGWEGDSAVPPGSSTVEVTLEPRAGATLVRLVHSGLPSDKRDLHREGWQHLTSRLRVAATGGDPGPDPMVSQDNTARWEGESR